MTKVRSFERQVRPVRLHLSLDRNHYLCGYVQRPADPQPPHDSLPLCGPCFVAFSLLEWEMNETILACQPPDLDLGTSIALLQETEWAGRTAHLDLDRWVREHGAEWAQMWQSAD